MRFVRTLLKAVGRTQAQPILHTSVTTRTGCGCPENKPENETLNKEPARAYHCQGPGSRDCRPRDFIDSIGAKSLSLCLFLRIFCLNNPKAARRFFGDVCSKTDCFPSHLRSRDDLIELVLTPAGNAIVTSCCVQCRWCACILLRTSRDDKEPGADPRLSWIRCSSGTACPACRGI